METLEWRKQYKFALKRNISKQKHPTTSQALVHPYQHCRRHCHRPKEKGMEKTAVVTTWQPITIPWPTHTTYHRGWWLRGQSYPSRCLSRAAVGGLASTSPQGGRGFPAEHSGRLPTWEQMEQTFRVGIPIRSGAVFHRCVKIVIWVGNTQLVYTEQSRKLWRGILKAEGVHQGPSRVRKWNVLWKKKKKKKKR